MDCGTHTVDQAFSFNGESPVKWVTGFVDLGTTFRYFDIPAEEMFTGTIVYENGVRASIQVGGPDMDLWGGVRVIGEKGFLDVMWDGEIKNSAIYIDPTWRAPELTPGYLEKPVKDVVKNITDCLISGETSQVDYHMATRTVPLAIRDIPLM